MMRVIGAVLAFVFVLPWMLYYGRYAWVGIQSACEAWADGSIDQFVEDTIGVMMMVVILGVLAVFGGALAAHIMGRL